MFLQTVVGPVVRTLRYERSGGAPRLLGAIGVARLDGVLASMSASEARRRLVELRELLAALDNDEGAEREARITEILACADRLSEPAATTHEVARLEAPAAPEIQAQDLLRDHGLAEELVAAFAEAGVETLGDLLSLPPEGRAEVFPTVHGAGRELPAGRIAVGGRVRWRITRIRPGMAPAPELHLAGAGPLPVTLAEPVAAWDAPRVVAGAKIVVVGQCGDDGAVVDGEIVPVSAGNGVRVAAYGVPGVPDPVVRSVMRFALSAAAGLEDPLPEAVREREGLLSLAEAVSAIHLGGDVARARERLAFDEAWLLQLGVGIRRFHGGRERGAPQAVIHGAAALMASTQGYELSDLEEVAFDRIRRDMRSSLAMRRVILTDGASRQRFVARMAAAAVTEAKGQVVWVCEESAVSRTTSSLRDAMRALNGTAMSASDPRIVEGMRRGEVGIAVGSPATLATRLDVRRLGLVVADGPAAWSEVQSNPWLFRAPKPDVLVLASEPFPVSSLLGSFGDFEVSACFDVDARGARGQVWVSSRDAAFAAARAAVDQGRQCVVVVPQHGGHDVIDQRSAAKLAGTLHDTVFRGLRIGLLHGEMPADEARAAWAAFDAHAVDVLVATTAVELGRSPARPAVVIVEQSERVPIGRLARLRGWAAPHGELYYLVDEEESGLIGSIASGASWSSILARTEEVVEPDSSDGDDAASLPTSWASGGLRWLKPAAEVRLLLRARDAAHAALAEDPALRTIAGGRAGKALVERWDDWFEGPCPLATPGGSRRKRRRRRRR
jgi:hypothetical protein